MHFQKIIGISVVGIPKLYDLFVTNTFFISLTGDKNLRTMRLMQIGTQWPQMGGIRFKWTWIELNGKVISNLILKWLKNPCSCTLILSLRFALLAMIVY